MTQSTAFTVAMLAWGLSAYPKAYSSAKATNAALTQVEVGIGYLQKTMVGYTAGSTNYYLVYQARAVFSSPSVQTLIHNRVYSITRWLSRSCPCTLHY